MRVPEHTQYEKFNEFLRFVQGHGYQLLYSIGETRVLGRRGELGGDKVRVAPGDEVYVEGDELKVST